MFENLFNNLKNKLPSSVKIVIVGDFNIDISDNKEKSFLYQFAENNFNLQLPLNSSSTNYNTQIDLCFANFHFDCKYYENYFGYHKAITGILNKSPEQNITNDNENNQNNEQLPVQPEFSNMIYVTDTIVNSNNKRMNNNDCVSRTQQNKRLKTCEK